MLGDIAVKSWLIVSMCWTIILEAIAPPPKPIPNIWILFSRERRVRYATR
ncbi:hypothetical protein I8752_23370 [Nostocaceae cyanobacterium CENA369]|uniref:Uncharacterized protein n=1 Tax=Dendronalium phyllosphericum CENA369 TaxID=1725256 RepID=A0A8J7IAH7_9NOST|nr:hypothetical protein [Dendronalium phyllosphericum]MBH8575885.1 hypothetical protein [Dendronalium phyllosphericum CENA369]